MTKELWTELKAAEKRLNAAHREFRKANNDYYKVRSKLKLDTDDLAPRKKYEIYFWPQQGPLTGAWAHEYLSLTLKEAQRFEALIRRFIKAHRPEFTGRMTISTPNV